MCSPARKTTRNLRGKTPMSPKELQGPHGPSHMFQMPGNMCPFGHPKTQVNQEVTRDLWEHGATQLKKQEKRLQLDFTKHRPGKRWSLWGCSSICTCDSTCACPKAPISLDGPPYLLADQYPQWTHSRWATWLSKRDHRRASKSKHIFGVNKTRIELRADSISPTNQRALFQTLKDDSFV